MQKKIVITGGPGTGKSTVINELEKMNHICMHEISREVTLMAKKNGIEQLFLKEPLLFSKLLLEGRVNQYKTAHNTECDIVFFDRGVPDVHAYMNYMAEDYPSIFLEKSKEIVYYKKVLIMPPWKDIYITDNERYESFEQSLAIYNHLKHAYVDLGYELIEVPFGTVQERAQFVIEQTK